MARKPVAPKPAKAKPIVDAVSVEVIAKSDEPVDWWHEEPKRALALEHILNGMAKMQVAKKLDVHRNTINNWCADQRFIAESNLRMREHMGAKRIRRMKSTNLLGDKIERVTMALISKVETQLDIDDDPNSKTYGQPKGDFTKEMGSSLRTFREMNYEFRETREQERKDFGDDIKKVAINSQHTITGDVAITHSGVNETPFVDFIKRALNERTIDVNAIEMKESNGGQLLLATIENLLVDTDLLEQINDEDIAADEARKA